MAFVHSVKAELAARYSLALFELAEEKGQVSAVKKELLNLKQMIDESKDFAFVLACPTISRREKQETVLAVAEKAGFSKLLCDFLGVVAQNNRLFALPEMVDSFFDLIDEKDGIIKAEVTSAWDISAENKEKITNLLASSLGKKSIQLSVKKDASLLGGLTVRIGSLLIDNSLKTKIQQLKTVMKGA